MNKKKCTKEYIYDNYTWIISAFFALLFMLFFMIILRVSPFGIRSFINEDAFHQLYSYMAVLQRKLKNGESLFYYWNNGAGESFLPIYFYYLASPFNLLIVCFEKSAINSFLCIEIAVKIVISAGTFGYYLSHKNDEIKNNPLYIGLSLGYAFSAFVCSYFYQAMWLDSIMIFPLIILGYERLVHNNKPFLYIFTLSYSLLCNYYISYIICLFLVIWFILDDYNSIKDFFIRGIRFILSSLVSAGLMFMPLLISFLALKETGSSGEAMVDHEWYGNIFNVIRKAFFASNPTMISNSDNSANIYCGTIVILFVFAFCFIKDIKPVKRIKRVMLLLLLLTSMNESVLNFIWHGFHVQHSVPNRFAFIYIFILLITVSDVIEYLNKDNTAAFLVGAFISVCLPIVSFVFVDYDSLIGSGNVILITCVLLFSYNILVLLYAFLDKKPFIYILSILMVFEILINAGLCLKSNLTDYSVENSIYADYESAVRYIEDNDDSAFYRSEVADPISLNQCSYHGINGVGVFNSLTNDKFLRYSSSMGENCRDNIIMYKGINTLYDNTMGIKYIYTSNDNNEYKNSENYEEYYNHTNVKVYKNKNAASLGFSIPSTADIGDNIANLNGAEFLNRFSRILGCEDELITPVYQDYTIQSTNCVVNTYDDSVPYFMYQAENENMMIDVSFTVEEPDEYYIYILDKNYDNITIRVNQNTIKSDIWICSGLSFIGDLNAGDLVDIIFSYNSESLKYTEYNAVTNVMMMVFKYDIALSEKMFNKIRNNSFDITSFSDNEISGNIALNEKGVLMTTIPFNKGWHVYDNNKEVKKVCIADAFLGVELEKGNHNLILRFIPQGFIVGCIVSVISLIILVIYNIYSLKIKKEKSEES